MDFVMKTHIGTEEEVWLPAVGWEGFYEVSNMGRLKRLSKKANWTERNGANSVRTLGEAIMKHNDNVKAYILCSLSDGVRRKSIRLHRLVAETFIPNPENKPHINHIDGNKTNNKVSNLEWCTPSENILHSYKIGTHKPMLGEGHWGSKLSNESVHSVIEMYKSNVDVHIIAQKYCVTTTTIRSIISGVSWKHLNIL